MPSVGSESRFLPVGSLKPRPAFVRIFPVSTKVAQIPIHLRKFTEGEVREILKRAADEELPGGVPGSEGLSLVELKAIAQEVGIDPARLEDVARAVAQNQEPGLNPIAGTPTLLRYERVVDGELDLTRQAPILSVIRRATGHHGEVAEVGGSLEWRTRGGSVERLVSISSNAGRTTIEGSANLRQAVVGTYLSLGTVATVLGFLGIAASVSDVNLNIGGLVLSAGFLAAAYAGLRAMVKKVHRSESAQLERAVNELAELASGRSD